MHPQETLRPAVPPYLGPLPTSRASQPFGNLFNNCDVSYGLPFTEACANHVHNTFHAKRVYILASTSLARSTTALADLRAALGGSIAGVRSALRAHTYVSDVLACVEECRKLGVDLVVTLGGGTLTDAAKLIVSALANDVATSADLHRLPTTRTAGTVPPANPPTIPVICIATTLSGGEFTLGGGATDDSDNQKYQWIAGKAIHLVILDAALVTATTPLDLLIQSGFRAVDHCVEGLCSPYSTEVTTLHGRLGLQQLVPALLRCKADGEARTDVEARLLCQMAAIDAVAATNRVYTPPGASHAIGHVLGPFGVGHGATSGILLPVVCKYNARHGADLECQASIAELLWVIPEMRQLAESRQLVEGVADLGDLLDVFARALGMARTLADVGVGRDKFDTMAEHGVLDSWAVTNPVPITEKAQVMEILEMVAE